MPEHVFGNNDPQRIVIFCQDGVITGLQSEVPCQCLVVNYKSDPQSKAAQFAIDNDLQFAALTSSMMEVDPLNVETFFEVYKSTR